MEPPYFAAWRMPSRRFATTAFNIYDPRALQLALHRIGLIQKVRYIMFLFKHSVLSTRYSASGFLHPRLRPFRLLSANHTIQYLGIFFTTHPAEYVVSLSLLFLFPLHLLHLNCCPWTTALIQLRPWLGMHLREVRLPQCGEAFHFVRRGFDYDQAGASVNIVNIFIDRLS